MDDDLHPLFGGGKPQGASKELSRELKALAALDAPISSQAGSARTSRSRSAPAAVQSLQPTSQSSKPTSRYMRRRKEVEDTKKKRSSAVERWEKGRGKAAVADDDADEADKANFDVATAELALLMTVWKPSETHS